MICSNSFRQWLETFEKHGNTIFINKDSKYILAFHGVTGSHWIPSKINEKFHCGTLKSAQDRIFNTTKGRPSFQRKGIILAVKITMDNPYLPKGKMLDERKNPDRTEIFSINNLRQMRDEIAKLGHDVIPYVNGVEDPGSVSYMVLDPSKVEILGEVTEKGIVPIKN